MRQQLDVDRAPQLDSVKEWAEYIQAELEELANAQATATSGQAARGRSSSTSCEGSDRGCSKPWERNDGAKAPCRF